MLFIAYAFKGQQVHVFAGQVKIASHSSCRTSAILKYFCTLRLLYLYLIQQENGSNYSQRGTVKRENLGLWMLRKKTCPQNMFVRSSVTMAT